SIAIGFGGEPLLARGYGYKAGPPTAGCATEGDPFVGGPTVKHDTAFRVGSNSKGITAAILRAVLKQKLAAEGRPATDADVEALLVFDPETNLVSRDLLFAVRSAATGGGAGPCVPGAV